jgi:hypothetical protein
LYWDETISNKLIEIDDADKDAFVKKKIAQSEAFMGMLGHILSMGNVLNGGTPKGQSDGFEL